MAYASETSSAELDEYAEETVAGIVEDKQKKPGRETVGAFTDDVETKAKEHVAELRAVAGDQIASTIGPKIMREAKSYAEARKEILDPHANVGDAAAIGAAAYVDMGTREITHDTAAMDFDMTPAEEDYRRRTQAHEEVHQKEQAAEYNATELHIIDESGTVKTYTVEGDLTEGEAVQENEMSDLTPDYVGHHHAWHEITDVIDEGKLRNAMKTGDIAAVQREHVKEVLGEQVLAA